MCIVVKNYGSKAEEQKAYGVFKERGKWVAVTHSLSKKRERDEALPCYFLGRFDSEDEAIRSYKKAMEEIQQSGVYFSSKGGKIVPPFSLSMPSALGMAPGGSLTQGASSYPSTLGLTHMYNSSVSSVASSALP